MSMMQKMKELGTSITGVELNKEIVSRIDKDSMFKLNRTMEKIAIQNKIEHNKGLEELYKNKYRYSSPKAIDSHEFESKKVLTYHNKH